MGTVALAQRNFLSPFTKESRGIATYGLILYFWLNHFIVVVVVGCLVWWLLLLLGGVVVVVGCLGGIHSVLYALHGFCMNTPYSAYISCFWVFSCILHPYPASVCTLGLLSRRVSPR